MHHNHLAAIAVAAFAAMLPTSSRAQSNATASAERTLPGAATAPGHVGGSSSVTIVLVPSLPAADARAVILRRARAEPQNVILVGPSTTAADLTKAVATLFDSRRGQGEVVTRDMLARVSAADLRSNGDSLRSRLAPGRTRPRNLIQAERQLSRLRSTRPVDVTGVGTYPARVVPLGPLARQRSKGNP